MDDSVNDRLKALRLAARPRLSIRAMADALGMPTSSYNYFEDPNRFKRRALPLDFARKVAAVLGGRGVDPADVMALAGLNNEEAAPEAHAITSRIPPLQQIMMPVMLPSEAAMSEMFEALLLSIGEGHPRAEIARQLAQLLPVGLATLQGRLIDQPSAASPAHAANLPAHASADRARPLPRHI